jgi:hypothetical protein
MASEAVFVLLGFAILLFAISRPRTESRGGRGTRSGGYVGDPAAAGADGCADGGGGGCGDGGGC